MDTNDHSNVLVIQFVSCFGVVFMPFVSLYLRIHSFIYLGSVYVPFKIFSSYETSQSVGVVKTANPEKKKKKNATSSSRTCLA